MALSISLTAEGSPAFSIAARAIASCRANEGSVSLMYPASLSIAPRSFTMEASSFSLSENSLPS